MEREGERNRERPALYCESVLRNVASCARIPAVKRITLRCGPCRPSRDTTQRSFTPASTALSSCSEPFSKAPRDSNARKNASPTRTSARPSDQYEVATSSLSLLRCCLLNGPPCIPLFKAGVCATTALEHTTTKSDNFCQTRSTILARFLVKRC